MAESVLCRGCGRRVVLPESINRRRARCPKCRTKIEPPQAAPVPQTPDVYEIYLTQSLELQSIQAPAKTAEQPLDLPEEEALSLDDAPAADPRPHVAAAFYPPPFRFAVHVLADSTQQHRGPFHGVLTPHGLFLEKLPSQPLLFVPFGTQCKTEGVALRLADRSVTLRVDGVSEPEQLAADTAAFLAGKRPVPLPAEYRRPWRLVGIGTLLALGIAVLVLFLIAAMLFLAEPQPTPSPQQQPVEPATPGEPPPPSSGTPSTPPVEPTGPLSHLAPIYRDGKTRLDDGTANVTALAISPIDGAVVIGYADGSTCVWPLDQPAFEPPRLGPRGSSAVRRIDFDASGKTALIACDGGLVIASIAAPPRSPLLIPGEQVVALMEPNRERFAALRAGRVHVRFIPMPLVKAPPDARASKGFVTTTNKDETIPAGFPAMGLAPNGGKSTLLAWHPSGRLLCGGPDGSIVSVQTGTPMQPAFSSREHKAAVRTWAASPWGDFATGDDDGFVGYWPNKTTKITKFKTGGLAIKGMAFNPCGGELAVVDSAGWVSVWIPATGKKVFEVRQQRPIAAISYGPFEDLLMLADGKGVEIWFLPELAAQAAEK